jgi:hypothetical protein
MSKHNNRYLQQVEAAVRKDINRMDNEEILYMYGITVDESFAVYDTINDITYQSIDSWLDEYLDDSKEDVKSIGQGYEWDD